MKEHYERRLEQLRLELQGLKVRDRTFSLLRLALALAVLAAGYLWFRGGQGWWWGVVAVLTAVFALVLKFHQRLRGRIALLERKAAVNEDELAALSDRYERFADGSEFIDCDHLFASDLDLFGPRSLFQRMNRTSTQAGHHRLAGDLLANDLKGVSSKQAAVRELSELPEWREAFRAHGKRLREDVALPQKLGQWVELPPLSSPLLHPVLLWTLTFVFPAAAISLVLATGFEHLGKLVWLGLLNLAFFGLLVRSIRRERTLVDSLSKSLEGYSAMMAMVEQAEFESTHLRTLGQKLERSHRPASEALKSLDRILGQLDSLDNLVGALAMNALFLYHLHVYRQLRAWKLRFAPGIHHWLEALGEIDRWVSIAGFAFNRPGFAYPTVEAGQGFEAGNIGHPFIDAAQRVDNSIRFEGFKLVILTGSNMAGKSTFLRALGVNIVLAGLGAPVCAGRMTLAPVRLLTSMKPQDSLDGNESYFQAEVKRLRKMLDRLEEGHPGFVLLDEILRGTNSHDKRKGTRAFLEKLSRYHVLGVIATHDVEIAELTAEAPGVFGNRFFESRLENGELRFDYRLREGVCRTPNATELMRSLGIA